MEVTRAGIILPRGRGAVPSAMASASSAVGIEAEVKLAYHLKHVGAIFARVFAE
ncbi:hypothetical protein BH23PSE1_BH23PSE1_03040 [soil metagenome]